MRIKTLCTLVLLTLTASLASAQQITRCGGPNTALYISWPTVQFDVCHTGYNPYENHLNASNVGNLMRAWFYPSQFFTTAPIVVNGAVFFGDEDGNLYAVSATTGALSWKYDTHSIISSSATPAVVNGAVYFGADDNNVYALNAANGGLLWQYTTGGAVDRAPTVDSGVVYISSEDSNLYALDAKTGVLLWKYALPMGGGQAPAVVNGLVYIAGGNDHVYAINAHTGILLWEFVIAGGRGVFTTPTVFQGVAYVASDVGMFALNALTGALIWDNARIEINISSPALANGVLYIGWSDNGSPVVSALNASTGAIMWEASVSSGAGAPIVANGVVYVETDRVSALSAATGQVLWTSDPAQGFGSPAVVNGVLYAPCLGTSMCAMHLPSQ